MVASEQVWMRAASIEVAFDLREAFPYLDALIQHKEAGRLAGVWATLAERFPAQIRHRRMSAI